jgi:type II secretory pathway component PulF
MHPDSSYAERYGLAGLKMLNENLLDGESSLLGFGRARVQPFHHQAAIRRDWSCYERLRPNWPPAFQSAARSRLSNTCPAVSDARRLVAEGERLAQALHRTALVQPTVAGIISSGEATGDLGHAINLAVAHMEYESAAFARLRASLTYPVFLIGTAVLSFTVIALFVLPRFAFVVEDLGAEPPALARGLLQMSATMREHRALIGFAALAGIGVSAFMLFHERLRSEVLRSLLRVPVAGRLHGAWTSSLALRSLATMLRSGMPASRALRTVAEGSATPVLRSQLLAAHEMLASGQPLSRSLATSRIVPERTVPLLEVGERTAQFAEMLNRVAEELERNATEAFDRAITLLQPTIVLILGALIAFVAATVLQTLYSIKPAL